MVFLDESKRIFQRKPIAYHHLLNSNINKDGEFTMNISKKEKGSITKCEERAVLIKIFKHIEDGQMIYEELKHETLMGDSDTHL